MIPTQTKKLGMLFYKENSCSHLYGLLEVQLTLIIVKKLKHKSKNCFQATSQYQTTIRKKFRIHKGIHYMTTIILKRKEVNQEQCTNGFHGLNILT